MWCAHMTYWRDFLTQQTDMKYWRDMLTLHVYNTSWYNFLTLRNEVSSWGVVTHADLVCKGDVLTCQYTLTFHGDVTWWRFFTDMSSWCDTVKPHYVLAGCLNMLIGYTDSSSWCRVLTGWPHAKCEFNRMGSRTKNTNDDLQITDNTQIKLRVQSL